MDMHKTIKENIQQIKKEKQNTAMIYISTEKYLQELRKYKVNESDISQIQEYITLKIGF